MCLRRFCLFATAILLLSALPAYSQIGIYGAFTGSRVSNITPPYPFTGHSSFWVYGGTLGLYDDLAHIGPAHLGVDIRGSILQSGGHKLDSALGGLRLAFVPAILPIHPYLQASAGIGDTNYGSGNVTTNALEYHLFGGVDYTILPRIDWRVFEVGGGGLHTFSNDHVGSNFPLFTISTGLVLRLP